MPFQEFIKAKVDRSSLCRHGCQACELGQQGRDLFVPATIPDEPKAVLVGEAPGADEVKGRQGFVGLSGQLLRGLVREVFGSMDGFGLSNICKCRPPKNATPDTGYREVCAERFLFRELQTLPQETLIICLGKVAASTLVGGVSPGNFSQWNGHPVLVTYHPAYCLPNRSPKTKAKLKEHLRRAKEYMEGGREKVPSELVTSKKQITECLKACRATDAIGIDVETTAQKRGNHIDIYNPSFQLHTCAIATDDHAWCLPLGHPEYKDKAGRTRHRKALQQVLDMECFKVWWHGQFDMQVLLRFDYELSVRKTKVIDAMHVLYLTDENRMSYALKRFVAEELGGRMDIVNPADFGSVGLKRLWKYNCEDSYDTLIGMRMLRERCSKRLWKFYEDYMIPGLWAVTLLERTGVRIDMDAFRRFGKSMLKKMRAQEAKIRKTYPAAVGIKLGSPKQVAKLLYDRMGYPVNNHTKSGDPSTDAAALKLLIKDRDCAIAKDVLEWKNIEKTYGTYYRGFRRHIDRDGRVRCHYHLSRRPKHEGGGGTVTGRLSSSDPNLQNIKRGAENRSIFVPSEGNVFLAADYSQIELRILAALSRDPVMLRVYMEDGDIHRETASAISGVAPKDVDKTTRTAAKAVNFGIAYMMGPPSLKTYAFTNFGIEFSDEEAEQYHKAWFERYKGVKAYHKRIRKLLFETGHIESPLGRIRHFPRAMEGNLSDGEREAIVRQAVNAPIQATGSDLMLYLKGQLLRWIEKMHWAARLVLTIHDGVVIDTPPAEVKDLAAVIRETVDDLQFDWCPIPLRIDLDAGPSWGELSSEKLAELEAA